MSVQTCLLTYDDLLMTPDDGNRYEIIDGELLVAPSPDPEHQGYSVELTLLIGAHIRQHRLGRFFHAPLDVRLSPHDIVQPDLIFIRSDRLRIYRRRGVVEGAPDLAVEIISPSSRTIDPGRKFDLYQRAGVPEYWLVDPLRRTVRIFTLVDKRYVEVEPANERLASIVIPGLVVDPAALFAELDAMFPDESDEEEADAPEV